MALEFYKPEDTKKETGISTVKEKVNQGGNTEEKEI